MAIEKKGKEEKVLSMKRKEDKGNIVSKKIFLPFAMQFVFDHQSSVFWLHNRPSINKTLWQLCTNICHKVKYAPCQTKPLTQT